MAVLNNTMLAGAAAVEDGPYKIEKSLRFSHEDSDHLHITPAQAGDQRRNTLSYWVKDTGDRTVNVLNSAGSDGNNRWHYGWENDKFYKYEKIGSDKLEFTTNKIFHDPGAWFHVCEVIDTPAAYDQDRYRLYINGRRLPMQDINWSTKYSMNQATLRSKALKHVWGGRYDMSNDDANMMLADVQYYDGVTFGPCAFGEFVEDGSWQPKKFKVPTPNNDAGSPTWSSYWEDSSDAGSTGNIDNPTNLFNGEANKYSSNQNSSTFVRWVPPSPIKYDSLEVYFGAINNADGQVYINGHLQNVDNAGGLIYSDTNGELSELKVRDVGSTHGRLWYVKIDGVMLVDGQVDPTTYQNLNNNVTWSNTVTGNTHGSYPGTKAFDGIVAIQDGTNDVEDACIPLTDNTVTWKPASTINGHIEIRVNRQGTNAVLTQNGTDISSSLESATTSGVATWYKLPTNSINSTQGITWSTGSSYSDSIRISAIKVDGVILMDGKRNNSYHLKFDDATNLGKDSLNSNNWTASGLTASSSVGAEMTEMKYYPSTNNNHYFWDYTVERSSDGTNWTQAWGGNYGTYDGQCQYKTGTGGGGSPGVYPHWRIKVGSTNQHPSGSGGHPPRIARFDLVDTDGTTHNVATYTGDNCSDNGTIATAGDYITLSEITTTWKGYDIDLSDDTPTNYEADDGTLKGNYCTLNPLEIRDNSGSQTHKQGNLYVEGTSSAGAWHKGRATLSIPKGDSGKWYYEVDIITESGDIDYHIGFDNPNYEEVHAGGMGDHSNSWCIKAHDGYKRNANSNSSYSDAFVAGDTIGIGYNDGSIYFWRNGTMGGSSSAAFTGVDHPLIPTYTIYTQSNSTGKLRFNFGQRPFKNLPTGYQGICTQRFPDLFSGDQLNKPNSYFDVKVWSGTGAARTITGLNFQPELVWVKPRTANAGGHELYDAIRGATKIMYSHADDVEETKSQGVTAFTSTGFSLGDGSGVGGNTENNQIVGWAWDCGSAAATASTDGSITLTGQWVNATAGFSMSTWNGTAADATVGHALGAKPDWYIVKKRNEGGGWINYHKDIGATKGLNWSTTNASIDTDGYFNDTEPTNTVFSVSTNGETNGSSGKNYLAYAFSSIPQYSAFGEYTGATSNPSHGIFIHTGFQPRWIMIKVHSESNSQFGWRIIDTARDIFNDAGIAKKLTADDSDGENTSPISTSEGDISILSNGFWIRDSHSVFNTESREYIWMAFAQYPMKTARAR